VVPNLQSVGPVINESKKGLTRKTSPCKQPDNTGTGAGVSADFGERERCFRLHNQAQ